MRRLIEEFNLFLVKCDGGYFGATNQKGEKIIKTYQVATNSQTKLLVIN